MIAALSIASLLRERIGDEHPGYAFESQQWSWGDVVRESAVRAAVLDALLGVPAEQDAPRHVGVLLENVPEYLFLAGGAAFTGVTLVGINPTRRGAELARDIGHTKCRLVITDAAQAPLLPPDVPIVLVDSA